MTRRNPRQRGWTLLELLLTTAIPGTLMAIAMPSYQESVGRAGVTRARGEVVGTVNTSEPATRPGPLAVQDSACATVRRLSRTGSPDTALTLLSLSVGGFPVSICYSRPRSSQASPRIGGTEIPFGVEWRTGGSTPAVLYTSGRISIAGLTLPPGRYVLYTVPGEHEWQLAVNRTLTRWADGAGYNTSLRSGEVGRVPLPVERTGEFAERLTLRPVAAGPNVILFLEWERVQVTIPITPG
jgi:hypothetical protein